MLKNLVIFIFGLFVFLQLAAPSASAADEDFYWKNSYGRGVGTIPPGSCGSGKEDDAGLCYTPCKTGYHGVGPACWDNAQESYGRGVGSIPHWKDKCLGGKEYDAGLCYVACKTGYFGVGPVCWNKTAPSYARGAGTIPNFNCGGGTVKDAGLCYTPCKANYDGVGPVCWGTAPAGYVDCGAGFATSSAVCGETITFQTTSVLFMLGSVVPGMAEAIQAKKAALAPDELKNVSELYEEMSPYAKQVKSIIEDMVKEGKKGDETVASLKAKWTAMMTPAVKAKIAKLALGYKVATKTAKVSASIAEGQYADIDICRDAANAASIVDPTNVLGVVAAYMYPVYGQ